MKILVICQHYWPENFNSDEIRGVVGATIGDTLWSACPIIPRAISRKNTGIIKIADGCETAWGSGAVSKSGRKPGKVERARI